MSRREAFCRRLLCRVFLGLALVLPASTARAQLPPPPSGTVVFLPPQNISNDPGASFDHQIAVDSSGKICIVWLDNSPGYAAVFFSQSSDGGITFSTPQNLSNDPGGATPPQIAVDGSGNIDIVWAGSSGSQIGFFSRSTDGGATFSAPVTIPNNSGTPVIALDSSGNIYASWVDIVSLNVFFSRSTDGGATFSTPTQVSNRPPLRGAFVSSLEVDAIGNIDLVWQDFEGFFNVWFNRSADGGVTFSSSKNIAAALEFSPLVSMALDSVGAIYVTYNTVPNGDIWLVSSKDGGITFSGTNVSNDQTPLPPRANPCCAQVVIDPGDNVDVVWADNGPSRDITFARSIDGGITFSSTTISTTGGSPRIAVDSGCSINVVWAGPSPNSDVFYSRSNDNGATFSAPQNLSNDSAAANPLLALDPRGNVNVVWADGAAGNFDIFFSRGITTESIVSGCLIP